MIKSIVHARKVQSRRALSRKHGYARAVIRYLLREHGDDYARMKSTLLVYRAPKRNHEDKEEPHPGPFRGWLIATRPGRVTGPQSSHRSPISVRHTHIRSTSGGEKT